MSVAELETITVISPDGVEQQCPVRAFGSVRTCKRRYCRRCGQTWGRAWGTVSKVNLEAYRGPVALVSITAPGADVLPWSCGRQHRHGGPRGCRVKQDAADVWAAHAPANWRALRDATRRAVARAGHEPPRLLMRVWEPQKRGVPHLHLVVGLATAAEREAAQVFVGELARLAPEYVFGFVDRKLTPIAAAEASRYLTSYLLGRGNKSTIRENIADPRMPRSLVWLTPLLTRATFVTMRNLRRARWLLAALAGTCDVRPQVRPEDRFAVASAAVALERVRILRAPRPPDVDDAGQLARGRLAFTRAMRRMYGNPWGPPVPAPQAAAA